MGQKLNEALIGIVDSIGGLKIEIWRDDFQHALEGHPEVSLEKIRKTLVNPIKVIKSKHNNKVCLFYALEVNNSPLFGTLYFCVVVSVLGNGFGKLDTAYETDYIKSGEILYPKEGDSYDDKN